eukprot:1003207-Pleurochrysis_carterae.AAC.6
MPCNPISETTLLPAHLPVYSAASLTESHLTHRAWAILPTELYPELMEEDPRAAQKRALAERRAALAAERAALQVHAASRQMVHDFTNAKEVLACSSRGADEKLAKKRVKVLASSHFVSKWREACASIN